MRVIAVGLLGELQVAKCGAVAQERELVLAAALAGVARLDLARVAQPQARLAEEVEADVGERDVLLQHRPVADPFAEALREHEVRVAQAQQVFERALASTQMCFTSSGIGKNVG